MSDPFQGARPYQVEHIKALLRALLYGGAALDASDTGTGKTYCTLIVARILGVVPFIIGPKAAKNEWERASKVVGHPVEFLNYEMARGRSTKVNYFDPDIFGPSFQRRLISSLGNEKPHGSGSYWQWTREFAMLVFDECHKCGGSTSVQGKMLRSAKKASPFVVALSATAAEDALQLKNLGAALGLFQAKDFRNWLFRHGVKPGVFGGYETDPDADISEEAMKKIHDQIFPKRGARMRRSLIPNFPETLIDVKLVEPESPEIVTMVKAVHDFEEHRNAAGMADYQKDRKALDMALIDPVIEMAMDSIRQGRHVAIFPKYVDVLDEIVARLEGENCFVGYVDGRQTGLAGEEERKKFQDAFQRNHLQAIIVNQQAGSAALSLHGEVEPDVYIFPTDSGRTLKQILGRVHRDGGKFSRQFLLGFSGTIQEEILLQSLEKIRMIDTLNDRDCASLRLI